MIYLLLYVSVKLQGWFLRYIFMNTKLLLVASSLLMAINYVNVVQAMEDNYDENNQAQAKTKLDL